MKRFIQFFSAAILFSFVTLTACKNKKDAAAAGPSGGGPPPVLEYPVLTLNPRPTTLFTDFPATIQG
ncbi:MAG: efflux RND transporter periplasmic adaptor subunit, partial [Flavisolibacter sp.]|nr:efflux RND transporter periplasmic adaptor subunit [Flavisolibacter sp.]